MESRIMVDLEALLAEAGEAPPCGPDLEYDQAFYALEQAATASKPGMVEGAPMEEPRWPEVLERAQGLLHRSKDLRVATRLTRALTNLDGLPGLAEGLSLVVGLLERYWPEVHPRLDDDPALRLNVLANLADLNPDDGLVRDVRRAYVIRSREHGTVCVRDVEIALGKLPAGRDTPALSVATLQAQLGAAFARDGAVPKAVREASTAIERIRSLIEERLGAGRSPDFAPLEERLKVLQSVIPVDGAVPKSDGTVLAPEGATPKTELDLRAGTPPAVGHVQHHDGVPGQIRSREEAVRALELVCQYFERHEPSHPAPLFIRRAQRLTAKSFVEIVRDLIPDSIKQVEMLAGNSPDE
jgi:type VI secretion system protein ImpA